MTALHLPHPKTHPPSRLARVASRAWVALWAGMFVAALVATVASSLRGADTALGLALAAITGTAGLWLLQAARDHGHLMARRAGGEAL